MCDTINLIRSILRERHMTVAQLSYESRIPVAPLVQDFQQAYCSHIAGCYTN